MNKLLVSLTNTLVNIFRKIYSNTYVIIGLAKLVLEESFVLKAIYYIFTNSIPLRFILM